MLHISVIQRYILCLNMRLNQWTPLSVCWLYLTVITYNWMFLVYVEPVRLLTTSINFCWWKQTAATICLVSVNTLCHWAMTFACFKSGIPNPWSVDRYRSVDNLVLAHSGSQWQNVLYFLPVYFIQGDIDLHLFTFFI